LAWYGKKLNLTQQKHTFTNQNKCTTTQNTHKTKARFSCLLRHLAWKQRGPILGLALQKFSTYLLNLLKTLTHLLNAPDPHRACDSAKVAQSQGSHSMKVP